MESTDNITSTVYELGIENELRFVIGDENAVTIELLSGFAEIFGSELAQNTVYTFAPFSCISLFSWRGCSVKLSGNVLDAHIFSDSLIMISVYIHACLEEQRIIAKYNLEKGPVCLVAGSMLSGKSTFCRFLLNYATRMARKPLYIDLDVARNRSSMPGTISILPVDEPSHIIEGFSTKALSVYTFGHTHPRGNIKFYLLLIKKVGKMIQKRLCNNRPNIYNSGVIIDTFSWTRKKTGYHTLKFAAHVFKVDVVFVISQKSLFKKLKQDMPSNVKIVFIPRQKGIVEHYPKQQECIRENLIRRYFYGSIQTPLTPYEFDVDFSNIQIYSATKDSRYVSNISVENMEIYSVPIELKLVNSILGLSYANSLEENVLLTTVQGFVCVTGVNMNKEVVTVLSPQPAPLPTKIFILSYVKFSKD